MSPLPSSTSLTRPPTQIHSKRQKASWDKKVAERQRIQAMKDKEREMKQSKLDEEERRKAITKERRVKKEEKERIERMAQKVSGIDW